MPGTWAVLIAAMVPPPALLTTPLGASLCCPAAVAICIFLAATPLYTRLPPEGSPLTRIYQVFAGEQLAGSWRTFGLQPLPLHRLALQWTQTRIGFSCTPAHPCAGAVSNRSQVVPNDPAELYEPADAKDTGVTFRMIHTDGMKCLDKVRQGEDHRGCGPCSWCHTQPA